MSNSIKPELNPKDKEWVHLIVACRTSGMSTVRWCRENNINKKTYYYHMAKIRRLLKDGATLDGLAPGMIEDTASGSRDLSTPHSQSGEMTAPVASFTELSADDVRKINEAPAVKRLSTAVLRITLGGSVIEVSNEASPGILSLVKEVLRHA